MTARSKTKATRTPARVLETRYQAEAAAAELAAAILRMESAENARDQVLAKIREEFAPDIAAHAEEIAELEPALKAWGLVDRVHWKGRKSLEMSHGTLGFRSGTPKLKTLAGWTWAQVTEALREKLPRYVRTVHEPARDALIAGRRVLGDEQLADVGVEVKQDERFYFEPRRDPEAEAS